MRKMSHTFLSCRRQTHILRRSRIKSETSETTLAENNLKLGHYCSLVNGSHGFGLNVKQCYILHLRFPNFQENNLVIFFVPIIHEGILTIFGFQTTLCELTIF